MRICIRILPALLLVVFFAGCAAGSPAKKPELPPGRDTGQETKRSTGRGAGGTPAADVNLPWRNDPEFAVAKKNNGTPLLVASYHATLPDPILEERHNISQAADYLRGAVVEPGEVFSLNARLGRRTVERGFKPGPMYSGNRIVPTVGGGICKIASVIYNVAILANQEIVERHPHSMTVPYVPPGQDATISYGTKDFKFRNNTGAPILIWAQNTGGTLYIAFYGREKPPVVKWKHQVLSETATWTEYVWDGTLPKGTQKVVYQGSKGISVHSWIIISTPDGKEVTRDLGVSAYSPGPRIVARGS